MTDPTFESNNATVRRPVRDQAVVFGVMARIWQLIAGPVTAILVTTYFSGEVQGYYYAFASLLVMQSFCELGLHTLVIYIASHEWASLRLERDGNIGGESASLSRLASFAGSLFRWYLRVGALFIVGIGATGIIFFWPGDRECSGWLPG